MFFIVLILQKVTNEFRNSLNMDSTVFTVTANNNKIKEKFMTSNWSTIFKTKRHTYIWIRISYVKAILRL